MVGFRWRVGAFCAVLSAAVLCFSLQPAGIVTAEDKNDKSAVSDDKVAASEPETGADDQTESKEKKGASKKSKKSVRSDKSAKKKANKKSATKSSQQPVSADQEGGTSTAGTSSGGLAGGLGGNTGSGAGTGSNGGLPQNGGGGGPGNGPQGAGMQNNGGPDPKEVEKVMTAQEKHTEGLMKQEGVIGTATGLTRDGRVVLRVYTSGAGKPSVPSKIDGIETEVVLSGPIRPLSGFAGSPKYNPQTRISRPVAIGVSSLNEQSPSCSGSICATGTLGCRLKARDGSGYYALSNNHVFADENSASIGNTIVQPGPLDNDCNCAPDDVIGQLYKFKTIKVLSDGFDFNVMDAAIIKTTDKLVGNSTLPDGYGAPRTFAWKNAFLGQKVMKYGRTTGFTKGIVVGINVFAVVPYDPGLALFVRQVEIFGDGGLFSAPGDSGSLVVDRDRFPVGLLFAGGGGSTLANPIQDVLDEFGMEIDGDRSQDVSPPGKIGSSKPE